MFSEKIGVTIITGFLGAGKTSLLNQILKKESDYKFVIIENEFSEFGIDAEIIYGINNSNIFELSNGCICCTTNTELQETLNQLLTSQLKFSHLLIETTGIAEPDSIIQSVIANNFLKEAFYIDSVICLVDAVDFEQNIEKPEAVKQIVIADTVILNKTEKRTENDLEKMTGILLKLNPFVRIIHTTHSDYRKEQIIGSQPFNTKKFESTFNQLTIDTKKHLNSEHQINSISLEIEGNFDKEKFTYWMEYFLLMNQSVIFRAKGILSFEGNSRKQVFQAVKVAYELEDGNFWGSNEKRSSKLVFIGKKLEKEQIKSGLLSLLAD